MPGGASPVLLAGRPLLPRAALPSRLRLLLVARSRREELFCLLARHCSTVIGLRALWLRLTLPLLVVFVSATPTLLLLEPQCQFVVPLRVGVVRPLEQQGAVRRDRGVERPPVAVFCAEAAPQLRKSKIVERALAHVRLWAERSALQRFGGEIKRVRDQHRSAIVE